MPGVDSDIEHRALAAAGNFAFRGGPRLVLSLSDRTATFTDHSSRCGEDHNEDCGVFKLVAYAPSRHLYIVQQSADGYAIYLVIDRNGGDVGEFSPLPYFSPLGISLSELILHSPDRATNQSSRIHIWKSR